MKGLEQIKADEEELTADRRFDWLLAFMNGWRCMASASCIRKQRSGWRSVNAAGKYSSGDWVRVECAYCGANVPLGPASDDDERVRVEISAADLSPCGINRLSATFEAYGANLFDNEPHDSLPANEREWVGYLAAAIAAHDDTAEGGE